jgi:hypothetical protein
VITRWTSYAPASPATSRRPSTRTRSRGCTPACARSTYPRGTSRIVSRMRSI